jgi:probable rRNA maturation factor
MIQVALHNQQSRHPVDRERLAEGVRRVLAGEGIGAATVSLAVVDDATMHQLNRQFLNHDYPTDVLTFPLGEEEGALDGEIVISADYAAREAQRYRWTAQDEMLLYIIHGALHLAGYDDLDPAAQQVMRGRERVYLATFELTPHYDE